MELITVNNANKIKQVLLNNYIDGKVIELEYPIIKTKVKITNVSESEDSNTFIGRDMKEMIFINEEEINNVYCLKIKNKKHQLYLNIGDWGYDYRIPNMHIVLGSSKSFGGSRGYFSQLEISQALEDESNIYIVKNLTKLAGEGAISRINSGLKDNKDKKFERRRELVKRLKSEKIYFDNSEWLVINSICKDDLKSEEKCNEILYNFIKDFINYSFVIEEIVEEYKNSKTNL